MTDQWIEYKLSDLCDSIDYGYTTSAKETPVGPKFLRITDIVNGSIHWQDVPYCEIDENLFPQFQLASGDIVIARTGATTGFSAYILNPPDAVFASYLVRLKVGKKANPRFISYFLKTSTFLNYIRSVLGDKSAQPNASAKTMTQVRLHLPSLPEQLSIANILGIIDDKIELNRQMNRTLEAIAQAIFEQWFMNGSSADKCRVSGVVEFDPRISIAKGSLLSYVDMKGLSEGSMIISNVPQKTFSGGSKFQNGDTLLARITPCLENGKTGFVDFLQDKDAVAFGSTEFVVMRPKAGISPQFVYCLARNQNFRECAIQSMAGSSGRQRVQSDVLAGYEITKPQNDLMVKFETITRSLFQQIKKNRQETIILSEIQDSLLPQLMSGKIRVKVSENEMAAT